MPTRKPKPMRLLGVTFYTIRGGELPGRLGYQDMLRYDTAFVCDEFPGVVAFPKFKALDGVFGHGPTFARWQSFVVKLDVAHERVEEYTRHFIANPSLWRTYQHPRQRFGAADYGKLEPFTLAHYLTVDELALHQPEAK